MISRRSFVVGLIATAVTLIGFGGSVALAQDAQPHVGVSIPAATHGWPAGVGWWAERTMKEFPNVKWEFQRAQTAKEQADQIEAMVEKGIQGLVVLPFDSDTPLPAIKKAKRQGVYVVSVDRGLREDVADVYLAGDNRAFGRKAAEFMAERMNGQGNIVVMRGMPVEIDQERVDGFLEVIKKHPGIKVLDQQPGMWNRQTAHGVMQNFLTKYPKIDAVWGSDDDMALGIEQAIREANRTGEMWILPGAGMKQIVKRVMDKDPMYPADITYPPGMIGAGIVLGVAGVTDGNEQALADKIPAHLRIDKSQLLAKPSDDPKQRAIKLDVHLVTPENAKEFYFPESVY
ncbi:MAG TPA: ABC transporter substrate-binding protein [Tepidisphaeraceae bacterium]|nr:ABC transporter substrate-binding protein [Tepidisphaeraceae bacterium]